MDVRLSPEQVALRDSVVQVVAYLAAKTVADLDDSERTAKLDAAVTAAGWRELRTATDDGRPWSSAVEAALVAEELARGLGDTAFIGPTLAAELRRLAGAPSASAPETVALSPDLRALDAATVAVDAAGATVALVVDGSSLASAPLDTSPVIIDLTLPSAAIGRTRTALGDLSHDDLARWTALGLALTSADLVGAMRGAVALTQAYAIERRQYGASIGSFQAVQHLLADAHVAAEGSRSVALHAAWAVDALAPGDAVAAGAVAKAYCARAARSVCETAVQVHGGIGNTWECLAHVYLRRALLSTDILGGVGPNLERVLAHEGVADGLR
jgi:alkylation response protein AidB-like acyl-CoA dehydrogenase